MRIRCTTVFVCAALANLAFAAPRTHAQAALLMEEPYGFFGTLNPTGHNAIYFEHICAETPVKLRRCEADEPGAVIARYEGIAGYDWIAIPLIPYLYAVEDMSDVPDQVDRTAVARMRDRYHEAHLLTLGQNLPPGSLLRGGWTELVGVAYERRIYAFSFDTTDAQDEAFIASMNDGPNRSHFDLLYNNCSDFARVALNSYFPRTFRRSLFPDAGMTTPKQLAWKLECYTRKHPDVHLAIYEIPQVPGYRHHSHSNKSVAESLATTIYAVPIALVNPYLAVALFLDYLVRGHHRLIPGQPEILDPAHLSRLTGGSHDGQNSRSAGLQAPAAAAVNPFEIQVNETAYSGQKEMKATHE
jgi:hypothetical protein